MINKDIKAKEKIARNQSKGAVKGENNETIKAGQNSSLVQSKIFVTKKMNIQEESVNLLQSKNLFIVSHPTSSKEMNTSANEKLFNIIKRSSEENEPQEKMLPENISQEKAEKENVNEPKEKIPIFSIMKNVSKEEPKKEIKDSPKETFLIPGFEYLHKKKGRPNIKEMKEKEKAQHQIDEKQTDNFIKFLKGAIAKDEDNASKNLPMEEKRKCIKQIGNFLINGGHQKIFLEKDGLKLLEHWIKINKKDSYSVKLDVKAILKIILSMGKITKTILQKNTRIQSLVNIISTANYVEKDVKEVANQVLIKWSKVYQESEVKEEKEEKVKRRRRSDDDEKRWMKAPGYSSKYFMYATFRRKKGKGF